MSADAKSNDKQRATRRRAAKKSFVQELFEGVLTNETRCLSCESVTSKDERFLDLSVDVTQNTSITHCFEKFSAVERLANTDKFFCDSCNALQARVALASRHLVALFEPIALGRKRTRRCTCAARRRCSSCT